MITTLQKIILLIFFILITLYNFYEIYDEVLDFNSNSDSFQEVALEFIVLLIMLSGLIYFAYTLVAQHNNHAILESDLAKVKEQLEHSSSKLRQGKEDYQKIIQWQFDEWTLSPSEKEVALLMLKGLSIKAISIARDTKEKTVRTQASAIYEKSNLSGRHELSAWFFEDLL